MVWSEAIVAHSCATDQFLGAMRDSAFGQGARVRARDVLVATLASPPIRWGKLATGTSVDGPISDSMHDSTLTSTQKVICCFVA